MKHLVNGLISLILLISALSCSSSRPDIVWQDPEEFQTGNECMLRGDWAGAAKNYDHVIELDPNYAMAYNNRGAAHYLLGEYGPAGEDFKRAAELEDKLAPAWNNLGYVQQRLGDLMDAVDSHTRALDLNPRFNNAWYGRGMAYYGLGKFKRAARDFKAAMDLPVEDGRTAGEGASAALYIKGNADQEIEDYLMVSGMEFTTVEEMGGALWYVTYHYLPASFNYGFDQAFVLFPGGSGPGEMREKALVEITTDEHR